MSLVDYAEANPRQHGRTCWVCSLPEAEELNTAKRDRTATVPQMARWLMEVKGYPRSEVSLSKMANHFTKQHHLS